MMGFAIVSSPRVLNKLALQTSHKAASGCKGLFDLVANRVGRARARRCRWSGSPASGRSVAGYVAAFRAAQALADHGSWGAPACVAVGSIIVPTDRLPVDEDVVAGIWSPAATARSAQRAPGARRSSPASSLATGHRDEDANEVTLLMPAYPLYQAHGQSAQASTGG